MRKFVKSVWTIVFIMLSFCVGMLIADKNALNRNLIRLHVIADSDLVQDQAVKLQVRDAILDYLQNEMAAVNNSNEAKEWVKTRLPVLEAVANNALKTAGCTKTACVSFKKEEFDKREYDTFALPAGIYDSLLIEIGSAQGKNWWCVVFPALCSPVSEDTFVDTAVSSGFNAGLAESLSNHDEYNVRFFFLDCLGRLENFFSGS